MRRKGEEEEEEEEKKKKKKKEEEEEKKKKSQGRQSYVERRQSTLCRFTRASAFTQFIAVSLNAGIYAYFDPEI